MATAHNEPGRKPIARRLGVPQRFSWPLALSAILSLVFVVCVAALIAFMQYQTRLLSSQPVISTSQLVYYVEAEKSIEQELGELSEYSKLISIDTPKVSSERQKIDYWINGICSLFDKGRDADKDKQKCRQFLSRIPFKGTAEKLTEGFPAGPAAANKSGSPVPVEPISNDLLDSIMENFTEIMGVKKSDDTELKKLISLFRSDISGIAWHNQNYALNTCPNFTTLVQRSSTTCQHLKQLINIVSTYHKIDSNCDPHLADKLSAECTTLEAPAEGGPIIPTKTIGDQSNTSQVQPTTAEVVDQATNNHQEQPPSDTPHVRQQPDNNFRSSDAPRVSSDIQRTFELVSHYRFYDRISFGLLRDILISPNDFLALVLVCVGGVLGALLRIVFSSYVSGRDPTLRSVVISPILGVICSLVIYNLFRAGFIVMTDQPQNGVNATLSPFVIALLAMAGGLLSERTIEFFRKTFGNWLGSVEASQATRWGVNLQRELNAQKVTAEKLAERLNVSAEKIKDWMQEKEPVPNEKQREIELALNVPSRQIFTDIEPNRSG